MAPAYLSLAAIMLIAALAPFVASLIPGHPVPEVVFLVFAGAALGPHGLGIIDIALEPVQIVSELGMGLLFLMAGYEIDPKDLMGPTGRWASLSWVVSLALGFGLALLMTMGAGSSATLQGVAALAIIMTTTGYGTLVPIMEERGLWPTRVGQAVKIYGATGELLPVIAMSLLLSTRGMARTAAFLAIFAAVCLLVLGMGKRLERAGNRFGAYLRDNAEARSNPVLRLVMCLLIFLLWVASRFDIDAVLAAFAAGFILRALFPKGDHPLEGRLTVLSQGFFQPVFFIVSGAGINLAAAAANPALLFGFIGALVLVRGGVVALFTRIDPATRSMGWQERFSTAAYCTLALPVVVAVTRLAVENGFMDAGTSSVLVTSAALTVLLIPIATSFVHVVDAASPAEAVHELRDDRPLAEVVSEHQRDLREERERFREARELAAEHGHQLTAAAYLAHKDEVDGLVEMRRQMRASARAQADGAGGDGDGRPGAGADAGGKAPSGAWGPDGDGRRGAGRRS